MKKARITIEVVGDDHPVVLEVDDIHIEQSRPIFKSTDDCGKTTLVPGDTTTTIITATSVNNNNG